MERTIFADSDVTVTTARVVVRQVVYALANVTSVREFVEPRAPGFAILGLLLVALGAFCTSMHVGESWMIWGLGLAILFGYLRTKPRYWVRIGTAGAEANAIWSHDPAWTRKVVAAVNEAIVTRG